MTELQANVIAKALGGRSWHSGGGIWLVLFDRADGSLVCISDDCVAEYACQDAFDAGAEVSSIMWRQG